MAGAETVVRTDVLSAPAGDSPEASLEEVLGALAQQLGGARALVVGDRNGLPIASTFRGPTSMATTAMATLALTAATKVTMSLALSSPEDILIETGAWKVLVRILGDGCTLTAVVPASANLGLLKLAMEAGAREIRDLLDEMS